MVSGSNLLFLAVVATLVVHELDAVRRHEWRFFFARVPVSDGTASRIFVAAHLPAFVLVFWLLSSPVFRVAFDVFTVLHAGLHLGLRNHPGLEFTGWFSWTWILGGAVLGSGHLLWLWLA